MLSEKNKPRISNKHESYRESNKTTMDRRQDLNKLGYVETTRDTV